MPPRTHPPAARTREPEPRPAAPRCPHQRIPPAPRRARPGHHAACSHERTGPLHARTRPRHPCPRSPSPVTNEPTDPPRPIEPDRPITRKIHKRFPRRARPNPSRPDPAALAALGLSPRAAPVPPSAILPEDRYHPVNAVLARAVDPWRPAALHLLPRGARPDPPDTRTFEAEPRVCPALSSTNDHHPCTPEPGRPPAARGHPPWQPMLELFRGERKSSASSRPRAGRPQEA